jgi:sterol desaturase/sphingolipid hydroxylase (fatty acid hydroxylase superfamily)
MHLVHHSTALKEQQSNYGFALTIWDQLFGTYRAESEKGRNNQPIGLSEMQDERPTYAGFSLKLPLT